MGRPDAYLNSESGTEPTLPGIDGVFAALIGLPALASPGNRRGPVEAAALWMNHVLIVLPEPETFLPGRGPVDRAQHGPLVRLCPRPRPPAHPRQSGRLSL